MRDHAAEMAYLERQFKGGRKRAVLDVLLICVCSVPQKPVPVWANRALAKAIHDVAMAKAASWDQVFGKPHPRRKIPQLRKQRAIQWKVFERVMELRRKKPKPRDIFQIVADEFKIGRDAAKRHFEHVQSKWFSKPPTF
jgi:hypothetical protein